MGGRRYREVGGRWIVERMVGNRRREGVLVRTFFEITSGVKRAQFDMVKLARFFVFTKSTIIAVKNVMAKGTFGFFVTMPC